MSGIQLNGFTGHDYPVTSVAWNPIEPIIASGSIINEVKLWDSNDGTEIMNLGVVGEVSSVAWNPIGTIIITASEDSLAKWFVKGSWSSYTSFGVNSLSGHTGRINSIAWSPDGTKFATGSDDQSIRIWASNGDELNVLLGHTDRVNSVSWSPDGTKIASGSDDESIKIWDSSGIEIANLTNLQSAINTVAWSPDCTSMDEFGCTYGRLATGSDDGIITFWNFNANNQNMSISSHSDPINSIAWSPDGTKFASGSDDGFITIWNVNFEDVNYIFNELELSGHTGAVSSISWSPDGISLASGSYDSTVNIWDTDSGEEYKGLDNPNKSIDFVKIASIGLIVISASSSLVFGSRFVKRKSKSKKEKSMKQLMTQKELSNNTQSILEKFGYQSTDELKISINSKLKDGDLILSKLSMQNITPLVNSTKSPSHLLVIKQEITDIIREASEWVLNTKHSEIVLELLQFLKNNKNEKIALLTKAELKSYQKELSKKVSKIKSPKPEISEILEKRHQFFSPWDKLLSLIQKTRDGAEIPIRNIVKHLGVDEKQSTELINFLLTENATLGNYYELEEMYVKGEAIEDTIDNLIKDFKNYEKNRTGKL